MEPTTVVLIVAALCASTISIAFFAATMRRAARDRAVMQALLAANQQETEKLRQQLGEVSQLAEHLATMQEKARITGPAEFLITDAGAVNEARLERLRVSDQVVFSKTLGEPLVKLAALSHGVRHALSAESRNRIWFEMRREVRRARKERRRAMKEAWRTVQAQQRAHSTARDVA